jgi:hypothetical protein
MPRTVSCPKSLVGQPDSSPARRLDSRAAPSYPAHCAGDALGERASSLRYGRNAAGTPCPTPRWGVGSVLGKATARGNTRPSAALHWKWIVSVIKRYTWQPIFGRRQTQTQPAVLSEQGGVR